MLIHNADTSQGYCGSPNSTQLPGAVSSVLKSICDFSPHSDTEKHWLRSANDIPSTGTFLLHCAESMAPPQRSDPRLGISPFSAANPLVLTSPPHQSPCSPLAGTACIPEPTWRTIFICWMMNLFLDELYLPRDPAHLPTAALSVPLQELWSSARVSRRNTPPLLSQ